MQILENVANILRPAGALREHAALRRAFAFEATACVRAPGAASSCASRARAGRALRMDVGRQVLLVRETRLSKSLVCFGKSLDASESINARRQSKMLSESSIITITEFRIIMCFACADLLTK